MGVELGQHPLHVVADGVDADPQLPGDVLVGQAGADEVEDVGLAAGQVAPDGQRPPPDEAAGYVRRDRGLAAQDGLDRGDDVATLWRLVTNPSQPASIASCRTLCCSALSSW